MVRPKVTNVWVTRFTDKACRRAASRIVIEATLPPIYRVRAVSPDVIHIDLPGCALVMAPGQIPVNDGLLTTVTVVEGSSCPSITARLEHPPTWVATEVGGTPARVVVDIDRSPIRAVFEDKVIVVDPGHGGSDTGGRGPVNLLEKKVVLEIGRYLSSHLVLAGAGVVMTRSSDEAIPGAKRFAQGKAVGADAFVSIHTFSSSSRTVSGARTLYTATAESESLARYVQSSLVEKLPVADRGAAKYPGKLPADFRIPCVFVEVGTISNWVEEGWFRSNTFKERAAEAIVTGLKRYFVERTARYWAGPPEQQNEPPKVPVKVDAIPVRTHLVREYERIADVARRYTGGIAEPGDLITVAESVVAITQGRALLPESVRPGALARVLCRLPGKDGSLATPPAMQLAIKEAGVSRVLLGTVAAGLGRIVGRRGDFFRVAGRSLAQIDDIAGTMPPYDKHVILGPAMPSEVAREIKAATGVDAVVVDVNDIGCVDILGSTVAGPLDWVTRALADNPFGNDDQQTPIVVLKPHKAHLLRRNFPGPGQT